MQDLTRHLKEAIEINSNRMPLYGELSKGESIPFSKKLIRYEKLALLGAFIFDRKGDQLQKMGIPYMKAEFIEMSLTPKFSPSYPIGIDFTQELTKVKIEAFHKTIKSQIKSNDFIGIVITCQHFLEKLKLQKHVYCMLRHIVESMGRIAYLIPLHKEQCAALSIKDPGNYSVHLLRLHVWSLKVAIQFDEAVVPIQNQGIPFLYQDLPPIDVTASYQ